MRTITMSSQDAYRGPLILVNREHPIAADTYPQLAALPFGGSGVLMERRAAKLLSACVKKAGGTGVIVPVSGFRARDEQRQIWDDTMASQGAEFTGKYVAMPGCSEHETGLAIDLAMAAEDIDFIRPDFPNTGACAAFRRLAAGYGFIERYRGGQGTCYRHSLRALALPVRGHSTRPAHGGAEPGPGGVHPLSPAPALEVRAGERPPGHGVLRPKPGYRDDDNHPRLLLPGVRRQPGRLYRHTVGGGK